MNISHSLKEMSLLFLVGILLLLKVVKSTYTKVEEKVILYAVVHQTEARFGIIRYLVQFGSVQQFQEKLNLISNIYRINSKMKEF